MNNSRSLSETITSTRQSQTGQREISGISRQSNSGPQPGESLGRFKLIRELGRGGNGVVYEAVDMEKSVRTALKCLNGFDPVGISRFKNEFRALANFVHPNLIELHELFYERGQWFFSMELIEGMPFIEYVRPLHENKPTLNQERLLHSLLQIISAVMTIHAAGKLHRDLKPSNILINRKGKVYILDFGLVAEQISRKPNLFGEPVIVGTPAYMSPEQASHQATTEASDYYCIGSMMYEALTGRLPFEGTPFQILKSKQLLEPFPPIDNIDNLPMSLCELCNALLHSDPNQRPRGIDILRCLETFDQTNIKKEFIVIPPRESELFVGREYELSLLEQSFIVTEEKKSVAVFISGISGMGKSALLERFSALVANQAVVLSGRCYERESVPYKAFDGLIDELTQHLSQLPYSDLEMLLPNGKDALIRVFPVLQQVISIDNTESSTSPYDDQAERQRAFGALKELLRRFASRWPLILMVDDLQWGDLDSARLLGEILGPPDSPSLLFVGCFRIEDREKSPLLAKILSPRFLGSEAVNVHHLHLDILSSTDAIYMAKQLLNHYGQSSSKIARLIAKEAKRVPFCISELAHYYRNREEDFRSSITFNGLISVRFATLSQEARNLLTYIAVAGREIDENIACQAAGLITSSHTTIRTLNAANLVRMGPKRRLQIYHDRIRDSIISFLSSDELKRCHYNLAKAYEVSQSAKPEWLVEHYRAAEYFKKVVHYAIIAAASSDKQLAFNRSAELYRIAVELIEDNDPREVMLYQKLGDSLANAGKGSQSADAYKRALTKASKSEGVRLRRLIAEQLLQSGRFEEGRKASQRALSDVDIRLPKTFVTILFQLILYKVLNAITKIEIEPQKSSRVAPLLLSKIEALNAIFPGMSPFDFLMSSLLAEQFLYLSLKANESCYIARGISWKIISLSFLGGNRNQKKARRLIRILAKYCTKSQSPYATALMKMSQAIYLLLHGSHFKDGLVPVEEAEIIFRNHCIGALWESNFCAMLRYATMSFTGDFRQLAHDVPLRVRDATEKEDLSAIQMLLYSQPYEYLIRDEPQAALDLLNDNLHLIVDRPQSFLIFSVVFGIVDSLIYQNKSRQAYQYYKSQWDSFKYSLVVQSNYMKVGIYFYHIKCIISCCSTQPDPKLLKLLNKYRKVLRSITPGFKGIETYARAALTFFNGDKFKSQDILSTAIKEFEADQMNGYAICAKRHLGGIMGGQKGDILISQSDQYLLSQGIKRPEHFSDMIIPGFEECI